MMIFFFLQNRYPIMVKCLNIRKNIGKPIYRSISTGNHINIPTTTKNTLATTWKHPGNHSDTKRITNNTLEYGNALATAQKSLETLQQHTKNLDKENLWSHIVTPWQPPITPLCKHIALHLQPLRAP